MLSQIKRALPASVERPLRTAFGMDLLSARIAELERALSESQNRENHLRAENETLRDGTSTLPGLGDTRVLLPLDYAPSRDFSPRWGHRRPAIPALVSLFAGEHDRYASVLAGIQSLASYLQAIPREFVHSETPEPGWMNVPITALDAATLYYFMTHYRPKTYLEIGSGTTTCFARRAVRDHGLKSRIVSVDPQPRAAIDRICDQVIRSPLESVPLDAFEALEAGDILFFDGSHRSFMNSDVTVFMIDILPLLKPGVVVHVHDITLPYDYPDSYKHWYWNEQYLLAVYLMGNASRVTPIFPSTYVVNQPELMRAFQPLVTTINPRGWECGGSIWFTHA